MNNLKLSIITINLNNSAGLQKTIESIVNQTFDDYEYIIIDGGSADGSLEIIKSYSNKISYFISEYDNGIYNAMNKGILQAKGEYCLFLNSGDYIVKNDVLEIIFKTNYIEEILICKLEKQENDNGLIKPKNEITFYDFFISSIPHGATFIRRSLFEKIGLYNESYKIVSDWIFFIESIILHQVSYKFIDLVLTSFEEGGITSSCMQLHLEERKHYLISNYKGFIPDYYELRSYKISKMLSPVIKLKNFILKLKNKR